MTDFKEGLSNGYSIPCCKMTGGGRNTLDRRF